MSCTGLHGANRLASTSLLEGLVWGAPRRPVDRRPDRARGTRFAPSMFTRDPRLARPGRRAERGPRPHPAGLDDDPQHDVELRRHREDGRAPRPRRGRHPRPREAPLALLPRDEDLAGDRRPDPRRPREPRSSRRPR
ncbi:MAG: hypothetical protein M0C28_16045 [Candidatus Moduliflexus flocculans]|nr:hypothetical protein [Candidatus Moduliflexus flocculans]